ncbi:ethanolamine ammonia-lyase reactivating factor EutA [Isobaculum melis]|uniref:Reactivating factor of Adenosylcobalamin-dependent ethanolamine ammonia lyase n=1 Tax=Isobaculum melis TaxID=142588 RepID=A0A1H9U417_9LACT|nr:ethanolamine ammonia-lyase reactivating factor EutA [Isobaculum melis]SES04245.1 Reactivating factor of Adenosylcobalamin-dependent ethanolamine ammonia lyase [Isobaculum melis]
MTEKILSVGIDLGTSTTQLVLSELFIENMASAFSIPRIVISDKKVIYRSDIRFTPILADNLIDADAIKDFVEAQYLKAGIQKEDIQMGAVIITGETARKENASKVLSALSGFAGDFVVATAGPDLESIIAGKGAGAHLYSKEKRLSVVNLDIGGGTTNLALFEEGEVVDTGCLDIGGRLIKVEPKTKKITYIAPKIQEIINKKGLAIQLNQPTSVEQLQPIIQEMVHLLENSVGLGMQSQFYQYIITNKGLRLGQCIKGISFSGGVADCIAKELPEDPFKYGDIGLLLGQGIAHSRLVMEKEVIPSVETIRATVVGAGSHTAEVSGSTITYTKAILPIQNIPILKLAKADEIGTSDEMATKIREKLQWYQLENEFQKIALGLSGEKNPSFQTVLTLAEAIVKGLETLIQRKEPLIIMVQEDMAKALGQSIHSLLPKDYPFVCLDSVRVENGDYIDIGNPIAGGTVLPVVVKTLVFN